MVAIINVLLSAGCAWLLAWSTCRGLFTGLRIFDFVCGHNVLFQVMPSFLVLLIVFSLLSRAIERGLRKS